jgi:hypothetical protein
MSLHLSTYEQHINTTKPIPCTFAPDSKQPAISSSFPTAGETSRVSGLGVGLKCGWDVERNTHVHSCNQAVQPTASKFNEWNHPRCEFLTLHSDIYKSPLNIRPCSIIQPFQNNTHKLQYCTLLYYICDIFKSEQAIHIDLFDTTET